MRKKIPLKQSMVTPRVLSPYDKMILETVQSLGGFHNAHAHLDRADTLDPDFLRHINTTPLEASSLPLSVKQNLTGDLHRGIAYTEDNLRERMSRVLDRLISYGTTSVATCIDATSGIGEDGLLAIRVALELKRQFSEQIEIRICPNPIFGFKSGSGRWEIFAEAAKKTHFLSALPEKDYFAHGGNSDGKIGFNNHIRKVMGLGCELGKEVHLHLDQANDPDEAGTETLIEGLRWIDQPKIPNHEGPTVWAIHMISPSGYSESRFNKLIDGLLEFNIGVIVCPTAAISMRQLRPITSPTHNSIARVLELCKRKVPVVIGTDNIGDVFVPQSDGDMLTEIKMAGHALRFAIPYVFAKLAAGVTLNEVDRATIGRVLYQDRKVFSNIASDWTSAVE
jgi:cytosine deaminase